ncbi:MAG: ABC transporter ATP-binding protein [Candidatus Saccharimonadales bacterium]
MAEDKSADIAIKVDNVSKTFKLPHEKHGSLKSAIINFRRQRTYEIQKALDDISFEIKKGEFFGIVGRNGSGKSTLLKLMAGIYTPDKGEVKISGKLVPFIELGVGFNPELTGRENVFLNGALLGFNRKEMSAMYDEIVDFAELEKFMDQKLKNYSSGMQVRLAFSIAIRAQGDILLLDEVLAVGDSAFQRKCYRFFEDLKGSNTTVVLVSHSMGTVQRFCTSAILIDSGEIVKKGNSQEAADAYREINLSTYDKGAPKIKDKNNTVKVKIIEKTKDKIIFQMEHRETKKEDYYFGFSLVKDGVTFAELSSFDKPNAIKDNTLKYELSTADLNAGIYEISATLFTTEGREAVAYTRVKPQFIIKGLDETRGGAIRLNKTWVD